MPKTVRLVLAVLAFLGVFFVVWLLLLLLPLGALEWIGSPVALAAATYGSLRIWNHAAEGLPSVAVMACLGAAVLGGLGFVAGFFGPMILAPGANQGPLLGLFITGPAGVVIGAIAGAWYGSTHR
jgi:hypothetical protein